MNTMQDFLPNIFDTARHMEGFRRCSTTPSVHRDQVIFDHCQALHDAISTHILSVIAKQGLSLDLIHTMSTRQECFSPQQWEEMQEAHALGQRWIQKFLHKEQESSTSSSPLKQDPSTKKTIPRTQWVPL